jgi:copper oxidase (laccase) domain-containing protein
VPSCHHFLTVNSPDSSPASAGIEWQRFPTLDIPGIRHGFSLRRPAAPKVTDAALPGALAALGIDPEQIAQAEQIHGNAVACIEKIPAKPVPGVDALVTRTREIALIVRVADCGPVYLHDPRQKAIGLAHSGRKGTESNLVGATIQAMHRHFGSDPADLSVFLGPCIRPPHYEVDFAAEIGRQVRAEGVRNYTDSGICTASQLDRYYSYRAEKGRTGRMWAVLMIE